MSDCGITNFGGKFYISTTPANENVTILEAAAAEYLEVPNLGTHGDTGVTQNMVTYSTWGNLVVCKAKGEATAQDFDVEFLDTPSAGMTQMELAAAPDNTNNYLTRTEWPDGSVEYNRGPISGPLLMKGGNEDFKRVQFSIGSNQVPLRVPAPVVS